jgi:hypothetical protein
MQAALLGYDLEARVRVDAGDRAGLERVARYLMRPALAMERLTLRDDGLYEYGLRHAWRDGTTGIVLSPMELMEKLAALVPLPRVHLVRYHGILAPNHGWRSSLLPKGPDEEEDGPTAGWLPRGGLVPAHGRVDWAVLLKRVFAVDVLRCARCGGKRVVIEVVEPEAVEKILDCLFGPGVLLAEEHGARGPP